MTSKMTRFLMLPAALAAMVLVTGCSSVKRELGVGRNSPDEFAVVKRAPLTLPPEYSLRPPSADYLPPASEATQQARSVLMGNNTSLYKGGSAEEAFMARTGVQQADPSIRNTINRDNGYIALQNRTVADRLIFWGENEPDQNKMPASIVDAEAEAERLKKNM
jgi:hypothetical protein